MSALNGRNGKDPFSDYLDGVLEKSERKLEKRLRKVTGEDEDRPQPVPAGSQSGDGELTEASSRSAEAVTESVDTRIKQRMEEISSRLSSRTGPQKKDRAYRDGQHTNQPDRHQQSGRGGVYRLGELGGIKYAAEMNFLARDLELRVPASTVMQMASMVIGSPHVQSNEQYRQAAESVHLIIDESNNLVNAFAAGVSVPGYENVPPPVIAIFDGACVVAYMVSLALGTIRQGEQGKIRDLLLPIVKRSGEIIRRNGGSFTQGNARDIYKAFDLGTLLDDEDRRRASSYAASMLLAILAHELGHIVYGHVFGQMIGAPRPEDLEVSRNQERDADSFASSVITRTPFRDYTVLGGIFWWAILAWASGSNRDIETTHPRPAERVINFIREHRSQAEALGIDERNIQDFLPA